MTPVASAAGTARSDGELCDDACLQGIFGIGQPKDQATERKLFFSLSEESLSTTYGTIKPAAVRTILGRLRLDSSDVFTDAGSGIGNIVVQALANSPVRIARGIEFVAERHQRALTRAGEFMKKYGKSIDPSRKLELIKGDICEDDFSDSTVVFAASQCFTSKVMECLTA